MNDFTYSELALLLASLENRISWMEFKKDISKHRGQENIWESQLQLAYITRNKLAHILNNISIWNNVP